MAIEIERKFLVAGEGWRAAGRVRDIRQGYLSAAGPASVRIRIEDGAATLTVKSNAAGLVRDEFEYAVPPADAAAMLRLCRTPPLAKKRHEIVHAGRLWQVDVFEGPLAGLIVAEVEMESPDAPLVLPDWVGREVTEDRRYRNSFLAGAGPADLAELAAENAGSRGSAA